MITIAEDLEITMPTAAPSTLRYPQGPLLACLNGQANEDALLVHVAELARQRGRPWIAVAVGDSARHQRLRTPEHLCEQLGGHYVQLPGDDRAALLIDFAHARQAAGLWCSGAARRSLARSLLRKGDGFEIGVLNLPGRPTDARAPRPDAPLSDYLLAISAALVGALLALGASRWLDLPNISLIFLAAVLLVAVRSSTGPALLCAVLSFVAYGFYFLPPTWSVMIHREQDILTLGFFMLMALLTGNLAARQRGQYRDLQQAQKQTRQLLLFAERLSNARDHGDLLQAMARQLDSAPGQLCLLSLDERGRWQALDGSPVDLSELERISAEHAWRTGQPRGYDSHSLARPHWWWWPLLEIDQPLALLGVRTGQGDAPPLDQRRLINALLPLLSNALARVKIAEALARSRLHHETERLRNALLASVSHDLRTPLTAMRGNIETLQLFADSLDTGVRDELLQDTGTEAARLDRYIQNLLDMTRLGHGALRLERDWVSADDLVAAALQRLQPVLQPLQVSHDIPADTPLLWIQGALIEQALINVLENAARFSPPGGAITIRVRSDGDWLSIAVSDQGPGIPEDEQTHIFDMFYTAARGDRGGGGTGLGLAICQGMLTAHGGKASVASVVGHGSTLTLHLPLSQAPDDEPSDPEASTHE
ncbi:two-component system, OmpR family, sensor histidine kinase KdpD [Pseudomonas flavescens]|uniref:histidine kinase n=1 Tax=Phytopseudomonas flavescens TaxID=29435 RepID=A0A1G8LJP8_9GAMM|nr:ATP-binding protein [Pseudomonas flavescens]SDI55922.1 two-component system, OmpR family, sensor histidine kinase KdpD [Pseudomonas flavescens]